MKLNTLIAQQAQTDFLRRIFIDFQKRMAMVTDGFHAAYVRFEDDAYLATGGCAINLDQSRQENITKPIINGDQPIVSALFDARFLLNCIRQMKSEIEYNETAEDVRVRVEIYRSKNGNLITFSQPGCASLAMSLDDNKSKPFESWKPYLAEKQDKADKEAKA
jgi:hypothetical protein